MKTIYLVRFADYVVGCWDTKDAALAHLARLSKQGFSPFYSTHVVNAEATITIEVVDPVIPPEPAK